MAAARKKPAARKASARKTAAPPAKKRAVARAATVDSTPANGNGRVRRVAAVNVEPAHNSSYFADSAAKEHLSFASTGCATFDQALGGGFVCGRTANIVGDRSAGKTLVAMELCANFANAYPKSPMRYAESEAAFDMPYAAEMGIPTADITFNKSGYIDTVEALFEDMEAWLEKHKKAKQSLYIIDSLDALSDDAELDADFDAGSFGGKKPKQIGKLFRMLITRMEEQGCLFVVISQLRDKIGVTFGETKTRSGGKALDFYATHIVWLREKGKIKKTIKGIERTIGVECEAYVKKNKIGLPFRKADYPIIYGYGIDDMTSSVEWLIKHGREKLLGDFNMSKAGYKTLIPVIRNEGGERARTMRMRLATVVAREWATVETEFLPQSSKY